LTPGCNKSGLSEWIGTQLTGLTGFNEWLLLLIVCSLTSILTQIISNVTTAAIVIPIVLKLAQKLTINPVLVIVPPTLICSHGFVLPVSSAPNAMIFAIAGMSTYEMAKVGLTITLTCLTIVIISIMSYGYLMFDLGTFPVWANSTIIS
jgi:sodium-dependent dicarboxylate transporter 2/3/5